MEYTIIKGSATDFESLESQLNVMGADGYRYVTHYVVDGIIGIILEREAKNFAPPVSYTDSEILGQ